MRGVLLLTLFLLGASLCQGADDYPRRPVRVIVPSGPGSGGDILARLISQHLAEQFKETFVVDDRAGASGTIAFTLVAKAAADGYTLLLADTRWTTAPVLNKSVHYDVIRDFTPITQVATNSSVLVIHPSLKANTLKEFIALAKASPGKLDYGSSGSGTAIHLATELFKTLAKVDIRHVPYSSGSAAALVGLAGGQVQVIIPVIASVLPFIKNGQVRALAVTGDKRSPSLADVPSFGEAGAANMADYVWYGFVGPAGLPKPVISRLHTEMVRAIAVPVVKERLIALGSEVVGSSPENFHKLIRSERQRWTDVIRTAGITAD